MKYIYIIIILVSVLSCSSNDEKLIHYSYNNVNITRVDKGNISYFYYGYCNNNDIRCINESVSIDWRFDRYLFGFILFKDDSTVEIIDGGGGSYINYSHANSKLYKREYDNTQLDNIEVLKKKDGYDNLFQLSNDLVLEHKRNKKFGSKVEAKIYRK